MMFKIIFFLITTFSLFGEISIVSNNKINEKLMYTFLLDNFQLKPEDIKFNKKKLTENDLVITIYDDLSFSKNFYSKIIYNKKEYLISKEAANDMVIDGDTIAFFSNSFNKTAFIIRDTRNIYINGIFFLNNQILKEVLINYFIHNNLLEKNVVSSSKISKKLKVKDISNVTTSVISFLSIGIFLFIGFLLFSIVKKFGNPFEGD